MMSTENYPGVIHEATPERTERVLESWGVAKIVKWKHQCSGMDPFGKMQPESHWGREGYRDGPPRGDAFVKYDDHIAAMLNPMNTVLCRDMPSLYKLLQFIIDNIADLEQSPDFAGFQMQRAVNDQGELQFIRLVPCDKIGDVTVARIADVAVNKVIKKAVRDTLVLAKP